MIKLIATPEQRELFCSRCGVPVRVLVVSETGLRLVCQCPD